MYEELKPHSDLALLNGEFTDDDGVVQKKVNKWNLVFDFTTNPEGRDNFKLIKPSEFRVKNVSDVLSTQPQLNGDGSWLFELPIEFGGSLDSKAMKEAKDSLMVFDIKTGAE